MLQQHVVDVREPYVTHSGGYQIPADSLALSIAAPWLPGRAVGGKVPSERESDLGVDRERVQRALPILLLVVHVRRAGAGATRGRVVIANVVQSMEG